MFVSQKLLKLRLKLFFWILSGKVKKVNPEINLVSHLQKIEDIIFIFPMEESAFRVSMFSFRNIGYKINNKVNLYYLVNKKFKSKFNIHNGEKIYINDSSFEKKLSDEKIILDLLPNIKYGMIIDLNPSLHLGIAKLINIMKSDLKIGFKSYLSDKFYNLQFDISKTEVIENGYIQIKSILKKL